jgi:hypothetical protein
MASAPALKTCQAVRAGDESEVALPIIRRGLIMLTQRPRRSVGSTARFATQDWEPARSDAGRPSRIAAAAISGVCSSVETVTSATA